MIKIISAFLLLSVSCAYVQAESAEEKGLAIAHEVDARDNGFVDTKVELEMVFTRCVW